MSCGQSYVVGRPEGEAANHEGTRPGSSNRGCFSDSVSVAPSGRGHCRRLDTIPASSLRSPRLAVGLWLGSATQRRL